MNKPVFGKWTRVEDGLPEVPEGDDYVRVLGSTKDSAYDYAFARNEWFKLSAGLQEIPEKWMPLPQEGEDAFTELRALLDDWEEFIYLKHPNDEHAKDLIAEIRGFVGE